ncbi:hypothetical protein VTL71DRAFT_713, partial [Oculimacula yallundae]
MVAQHMLEVHQTIHFLTESAVPRDLIRIQRDSYMTHPWHSTSYLRPTAMRGLTASSSSDPSSATHLSLQQPYSRGILQCLTAFRMLLLLFAVIPCLLIHLHPGKVWMYEGRIEDFRILWPGYT